MGKTDVNSDLTLLKPELQELVNKIYRDIIIFNRLPIEVFETIRTQERQQWLFEQGRSKTINSRHLDGSAVDFVYCVDGHWSWDNSTIHYVDFLGKRILELYPDKLTWGGSRTSFVDKFHVELKR